jgi:hypothetical protein
MKFYNKALTLKKLNCKNALIPDFVIINVKDFFEDKNIILKRIVKKFNKNNYLIVRSSSSEEDTNKKSNAGHFESIPMVKNNESDLEKAINKVINSYSNYKKKNKILFIQKMIYNCDFSGVITTCNLSNNAPYYVVNYHDGNDTSAITSGKINSKRYYQFKYYTQIGNKKFSKIIKLARELEVKFKSNFLDIEFGQRKGKLFLFQVRPIIINKNYKKFNKETFLKALNKLKNKIIKLKKKHHNLLGSTTYFGIMPDWNPAEIIGIKPRQLSISLYQELITDFIWAKNRMSYGFNDMTSFHLMTIFLGTPYIDLRVDFNSWIPFNLTTNIKKKLIFYYLEKFKNNTEFHDKVEFEILFTCFNATTKERLNKIPSKYLTKKDKNFFIKKLKLISLNALNKINKEIEKIKILDRKQNEVKRSKLYSIDKIYWLIEDCKRYGTEAFAGLARAGFIAIEIINSLVKKEIITRKEKDKFMQSLSSITSDIISDAKRISKKKFCEKYGHLRPNTYDILSKNYEENYNNLISKKNENFLLKKKKNFKLTVKSNLKLIKFVNSNFKQLNVKSFLSLLKNAIESREYSKFVFTKSIDMIFRELEYLSKRHKIKLEKITNLNIKIIKDLYYNLNNRDIKDILEKNIQSNYEDFEINKLIELPAVILNPENIFYFEQDINIPNFFGTKKIDAEILYLDNQKINLNLKDKIICIRSADPGYDFIFNHNIAGLVTEFGGANSHMSIRCSELNISAAIGVGSAIFNNVIKSKKIYLDPITKKIN